MTSLTFLHRLSRVSCGTSSFPTALSRRRAEEIIQLDDRSKRERLNKTEDEKDEGSGKAKWPFGSYAMLVIPATTFCLGCWQTYRLRWKLDLMEKLKGRLNEPAVDFPLDDLIVMVNRGWVPASMISQSSRQLSQPKGIITLDAIVRKSETRPQFISENVPEKGQWFYKDFFEMARYYNTDPIYLEAVYESTIDGGPIGGQTNVNVRNDHLSYLLTWFSLSVLTFAMWIIRFRK